MIRYMVLTLKYRLRFSSTYPFLIRLFDLFQNVFIFPGIPELLRKSFNNIGTHIFDHSEMKRYTHEHFITETEVYMVIHECFLELVRKSL